MNEASLKRDLVSLVSRFSASGIKSTMKCKQSMNDKEWMKRYRLPDSWEKDTCHLPPLYSSQWVVFIKDLLLWETDGQQCSQGISHGHLVSWPILKSRTFFFFFCLNDNVNLNARVRIIECIDTESTTAVKDIFFQIKIVFTFSWEAYMALWLYICL